ncbi:DUF4179 domain-containing protein [uncultured Clostridium sp.]|uniref:DUF4179 domain-containing protein n=1 Tax=uncultured Clostridium sp. TaxID=59620 RepID=UPI0025D3973A|nr:DUF4179 domain-containing protein [uncultured Clostridium sp.]
MKSKKIIRILTPISGIMSFMLVMGLMATPVFAEETKTENAIVEESDKTDYATYVNSVCEKKGFKITLNKVTATKDKMNVIASIEFPNEIGEEDMKNAIYSLSVKNVKCDSDWGRDRKVDGRKIEINYEVISGEEFPDKVELRFDVIIPKYNLNAWVNQTVELNKHTDKIIEKDISVRNEKSRVTYEKFNCDILGSSLYTKEDEYDENIDYDDLYSDHESRMLVKCDDKFYVFDDRSYYFHDQYNTEVNICKSLTYDDMKDAEKISLIPVTCTMKNKDREKLYDNDYFRESDEVTTDNVSYEKEFKFADGKNGEISKIERTENSVKVYCSSDSEKKSLLMAIGLYGRYRCDDKSYGEAGKIIYKNPDDADGYIVEFTDVSKNAELNLNNDDYMLGQSSYFELGQAIEIK